MPPKPLTELINDLGKGCCSIGALEVLNSGLHVAEILRNVSLQPVELGWSSTISSFSFVLIFGEASLSFSRDSTMVWKGLLLP